MADEVKRVGRKLLIASLGVASVSFGACGRNRPLTDAGVDGAQADGASTDGARADEPQADGGSEAPEAADAAVLVLGGDAADDRQFVGNIIP